ncbi:hypothetical protein POM88_016512 [Heracleum sosnowskyi]|uniref:Uncharacterized protein n=1 Tax=Heracleum sosnowskyi TaxID=360622 RepID=A0AAD8INQ0_9APIA|nr:hypothetical protein POM88_016512 [Heracleum sosnowskyi]
MVVPLNTWILISNFKLAYNLLRRPDWTFNRHLAEFLDRKVPSNLNRVNGVFSFDMIIDRPTSLLTRIYRPAKSAEETPSFSPAAYLAGPSPNFPAKELDSADQLFDVLLKLDSMLAEDSRKTMPIRVVVIDSIAALFLHHICLVYLERMYSYVTVADDSGIEDLWNIGLSMVN